MIQNSARRLHILAAIVLGASAVALVLTATQSPKSIFWQMGGKLEDARSSLGVLSAAWAGAMFAISTAVVNGWLAWRTDLARRTAASKAMLAVSGGLTILGAAGIALGYVWIRSEYLKMAMSQTSPTSLELAMIVSQPLAAISFGMLLAALAQAGFACAATMAQPEENSEVPLLSRITAVGAAVAGGLFGLFYAYSCAKSVSIYDLLQFAAASGQPPMPSQIADGQFSMLFWAIFSSVALATSGLFQAAFGLIAPRAVAKETPADQDLSPRKANASNLAIFISYRRADTQDVVGRLYDSLCSTLGAERIFKDVDSIPLGTDFREHVDGAIRDCQVLLAVIGERWLTVADPDGRPRIELEADFVRIELEAAFRRGVPVIPVLVNGAKIPTEAELPPSLGPLAFRNGTVLRPDPDFRRDVDRLIDGIRATAGQLAASSSKTS